MSSEILTEVFNSHNFVKNASLVAGLIQRCGLGPQDIVVEIGPGQGVITAQLAQCCRQVIAIERDPALAVRLRLLFARQPNVTVQVGDFLEQPLPRQPYKVFANIPFNLTSAIVARLVEAANPPEDACLWLQKEAADMFQGQPRASLKSVLLQAWFEPEVVHRFRRRDFHPAPQVDVVLLRLHKRAPPLVSPADRGAFRDFVVYGFTAHPAVGALIKAIFSWEQAKRIARALELDWKSTPAYLDLGQWLGLFEYFKAFGKEPVRRSVIGSELRLRRQQARLDKIYRRR